MKKQLTDKEKDKITQMSQSFLEGFKGTFDTINGTGWLVVDPLSGYLNSIGIKNSLHQIPENEKHPQVLIMTFRDGSQFIPAGGDLKPLNEIFENWMWITP